MEAVKLENIWEDWHIEGVPIGTGSFGTVYKAHKLTQEGFGRDYYSAVKVIRVPSDDSEIMGFLADGMSREEIAGYYGNALKGLVAEIDLMESLKGAPNIVIIEDYKVVQNADHMGWIIYIRMELLKNLNHYRIEHPLEIKDIVRLGIDMCSALEYCGRKKIIHRDIKPDNIFINSFGDFKLGDFGIARQLEMTNANLSQKGTSAYMAPEIFRREPYNSSVDIYSLGMVLYRLLNGGRLPFLPTHAAGPEDTQRALEMRLSGEPLPKPAGCDDRLFAIIQKACDADMYKRWKSPTHMKTELLHYMEFLEKGGPENSIPQRLESSGTTDEFEGSDDKTVHMFVDPDADRTQGTWMGPEMDKDVSEQFPGTSGAPGQQSGSSGQQIEEEYQRFQQSQQAGAAKESGGQQASQGAQGSQAPSSHETDVDEMDDSASKKKRNIIIGCCCGAAVLVLGFFTLPVSMKDTLFDKVRYAVSDSQTRARLYVKKGDGCDGSMAIAYYKKALEEEPECLEAYIGALDDAYDWAEQADAEDYDAQKWLNTQDILSEIGALSVSPDSEQQEAIVSEVDFCLFYDCDGYDLLQAVNDGNPEGMDLMAGLTEFFAKYDQADALLNGKASMASEKEYHYEEILDALYDSGQFPDIEKVVVSQALSQFPENAYFSDRQSQINNDTLTALDASVDEAIASGDTAKAYEICASMQAIDEGYYNDTKAKIDDHILTNTENAINDALNQGNIQGAYELCATMEGLNADRFAQAQVNIQNFENTQNFLNSLKALMDARDYEGMKNTIEADTTHAGNTYYLVDGIYKTSVESGTGLIYDRNGLYYGGIENNTRKGQGSQFKLYSSGRYAFLEGSWDGQANGECTKTHWDSDGDLITTVGNYTDGYENGVMTQSWSSSGYNWSAQYTAENGKIVSEVTQDEQGHYIFVRAYAADGTSAWRYFEDAESLEQRYFLIY